jgi:1-acyl-sn-glycerol-3-phosphate acyltransferase
LDFVEHGMTVEINGTAIAERRQETLRTISCKAASWLTPDWSRDNMQEVRIPIQPLDKFHEFVNRIQNFGKTTMRQLLAVVRFLLTVVIFLIGLPLIMILGLFNFRYRGNPVQAWVAKAMARTFHLVCNVHVACTDPEMILQHQGLVFPNHVSFLDITTLYTVTPMRFLSAIEVYNRLILRLLTSFGAIYLDRRTPEGRQRAAGDIAKAYDEHQDPPIAVFPEGRLGTGQFIYPFRYGIFKIAIATQIPYLVCAIRYSRPDIVVWHGRLDESMISAGWRLLCCPGPIHAELIPIMTIQPKEGDDPAVLADQAQSAMEKVMGFERFTEFDEFGMPV